MLLFFELTIAAKTNVALLEFPFPFLHLILRYEKLTQWETKFFAKKFAKKLSLFGENHYRRLSIFLQIHIFWNHISRTCDHISRTCNQINYRNIWFEKVTMILIMMAQALLLIFFSEKDPRLNAVEWGNFAFFDTAPRNFCRCSSVKIEVYSVSKLPGIEVSSVRDVKLNHLRILQQINIVYKMMSQVIKNSAGRDKRI